MENLLQGVTVFVIFLGISSPVLVVGLVYYSLKRLEHKQILAAIEKGTPLSELKPPKQNGALWIRTLTFGIALIIIGLAFFFTGRGDPVVGIVLAGVGIAWLIRGLLSRKYLPQSKTSDENKAAEIESKVSA